MGKMKSFVFYGTQIILWVFLCTILCFRLCQGVLYPQWDIVFRLKGIIAIISPLAILLVESLLLRVFQKKWIGILLSILFVLFLVVWYILCSFIFYPLVSETENIKNYLAFDQSIIQTTNLYEVFPDSEIIKQNNAKYKYFNNPSFFLNGEYGFVFLSLKFADYDDFLAEKDRINNLEDLTPVTKTWDGFAEHSWNGYTAYSSVYPQEGSVQSFSWVLVSDANQSVIYYHRFYGHEEDHYLESCIGFVT